MKALRPLRKFEMNMFERDAEGNEIYPVKEMFDDKNRESVKYEDVLFPPRYAKRKNGISYYPLGLNGHEDWIPHPQNDPPKEYPISKDGYYVIPINYRTGGIIHIPEAPRYREIIESEKNILIKTFFEKQAIQTTIKSDRKPRTLPVKKKDWSWIIGIVIGLIGLLCCGILLLKVER